MLMEGKFKKLSISIFILAMLFQAGCASKNDQIRPYRPPAPQASYCSQYLCMALAPLFKEDSFVAPDITKDEISDSKIEYSLDYKDYGSIRVEVYHKNKSLPCPNPEAFVQINEEQAIAYDVGCSKENDTNGNTLKITYFPNQLNDVDEFKFLSLISHIWVGQSGGNQIYGKSSLPLKYLD